MENKISADALLDAAVQLFISVPKNKIDRISGDELEIKIEKRVDDFVKFYHQLRDKLQGDAQ